MRAKSEKAKVLAGEFSRPGDPELLADHQQAQRFLAQYNATSVDEMDDRTALLRQLMGSIGDGTIIKPIFACDYGYNIRLGRNPFINFNCVLLDCAPIEVGDNLQMGPAVQIYTATHPLEAEVRQSGAGIRSPDPHRKRCMDRRRRDYSSRGDHQRQQRGWRRQRRGT